MDSFYNFKFNFLAGQHRDWTTGAVVYIPAIHAQANSDMIALKHQYWYVHFVGDNSEYCI